jgi:hypothetical protein
MPQCADVKMREFTNWLVYYLTNLSKYIHLSARRKYLRERLLVRRVTKKLTEFLRNEKPT